MENAVIVTLRDDSFSCDMELPCNIALQELYPRMIVALKSVDETRYGNLQELCFKKENRYLLDEGRTLRDYGICTGMYLDLDWR